LEIEFQIAANACPQRQHFEVEALRERIEALKTRASNARPLARG
jgi:hypothetical protein